MKKTLGNLFDKISTQQGLTKLDSEIEMVSDDRAQQVRGGDKDYTPMYESESDIPLKWFFPSVLLNAQT
jgi:hypothetical protein